jgi:hypothetical protein
MMLSAVAILILGPLGGISAAFMNFSIGFYVGGQVLAGILGSAVTLPYGPEGKHGANYMQTMAASVAGMCGMAALVQAMVWLGLPQPPIWQMVLYFMCIGMFGVGLGMLYTPILVDRLRLTYPSGLAVANILRALTDKQLLKRSIFKLGGSIAGAFGVALAAMQIPALDGLWDLSVSTVGGGMIVGARIALPALWVALIGYLATPHLISIGWLDPGDHYRKIGFIISLGAIMGAAVLDVGLILFQAIRRFRETGTTAAQPAPDWKRVNMVRLVAWVVFWGAGTVVMGNQVLHQPVLFLVVAIGLCSRHLGFQSNLQRFRDVGFHHGSHRVARSGRRLVMRFDPSHCHRRRRGHAAGPLDRLATGHQSHCAIPLSGHRHCDGSSADGGFGPALHARVSDLERGSVCP